jgi:hypothetical protein
MHKAIEVSNSVAILQACLAPKRQILDAAKTVSYVMKLESMKISICYRSTVIVPMALLISCQQFNQLSRLSNDWSKGRILILLCK